jgi:hypothetical protein
MLNAQLMSDEMSNNDLVVISYHVEERINMPFGGSVTTYEVSDSNLISTKDLGENNVRVIVPKYGRAKVKQVAMNAEIPAIAVPVSMPAIVPVKMDAVIAEARPKFVNIDILSTYERVIDKGYKSVDMLKRVGNGRYFDGDLAMAAKWYSQLFELTTDLDAEYYFRYAQSLSSISQTQKANEMMAIFNNKNLLK